MLSNRKIKEEAQRLGFFSCGMTRAVPVSGDYASHFRAWLDRGCHADMQYLENYFDKRMDPTLLVPGTRSIVCLAMNYRPERVAQGIAWYAQGKDYHDVVKERLATLMDAIDAHGRCFVDTAPVPERYWAWQCGIGWIGRNTQLVIPHTGSAFFLGELFIEEDINTYDTPMDNHCGTCRRCIEACPTGALQGNSCEPNFTDTAQSTGIEASPQKNCGLDARRCLSYLTIENRGDIPEWAQHLMGDTFYGCDRCLKACPHLHSAPTTEPSFAASDELLSMTDADWTSLSEEQYRTLFRGSAVKRAKYAGLTRNIQAARNNICAE